MWPRVSGESKSEAPHSAVKKGNAVELEAAMRPELTSGIQGDGRDERDLVNDDPDDLPELREKMTTTELNELVSVWRRKLTKMTKPGVRIKNPTHTESM
jgi:hypothetical protein